MGDEPLTLKVMRLRQPQVHPPHAVLSADALGFDAPKLVLPMSLTQSLVGEAFSGYLHLSNNSNTVVNNVVLRVELQIGNAKTSLFTNAGSAIATIAQGEFFDAHVEHELKDVGTYVLTCNISYTLPGMPSNEPQVFKRQYRFPAVAPFSVIHRAVQLDNQLLIECTLENATKESIYLTAAHLLCKSEEVICVQQGLESDSAKKGHIMTSRLLRPQEVLNVVFMVSPRDETVDLTMLPEADLVGTLSLSWRVDDGTSGCADNHQVRIKPSSFRDLHLRVVNCPRQVSVEVPFELELEVINRTSKHMEPTVTFDMQMMGSVKVQGCAQHQVGRLEPFSRKQLPVVLLALAPGLHMLRGVFVLDTLSQAKTDIPALCEILAF
mmetsp:Transcript_62430/g.115916  ORF Transcript_62430/g.115916 Transcript_62430/m.115916 type:complete len:380 (-) Transcript_62430:23-1162(-)